MNNPATVWAILGSIFMIALTAVMCTSPGLKPEVAEVDAIPKRIRPVDLSGREWTAADTGCVYYRGDGFLTPKLVRHPDGTIGPYCLPASVVPLEVKP